MIWQAGIRRINASTVMEVCEILQKEEKGKMSFESIILESLKPNGDSVYRAQFSRPGSANLIFVIKGLASVSQPSKHEKAAEAEMLAILGRSSARKLIAIPGMRDLLARHMASERKVLETHQMAKEAGQVVTDGRTLRGMANEGHITFVKGTGFSSVRRSNAPVFIKPALHNATRFNYRGKQYFFEYFRGGVYPYVVCSE